MIHDLNSRMVIIAACVVGLAIALAYMGTTNPTKKEATTAHTMYPEPEIMIPHSDTTTPAPGYTSNKSLSSTPQYICKQVDRRTFKERKSMAPDQCRPGEEKIGFACYTSCDDKWKSSPDFPDTCQRCKDYSETCEFLDTIVRKRTRTGTAVYCRQGWDKYGGLCYEQCPKGYKAEANLCFKCI